MSKGFCYTLEKEDILNYMKFSTEEKLKWLEEIVVFTEEALTAKEKRVREYFRGTNLVAKQHISLLLRQL
ncbi:MAG: hypothetical protein ABH886_09540 [Candidatus Desantisbacteria bacterium]